MKELKTPYGNISDKMISYIGRDLYRDPNHPLGIIKIKIEDFFESKMTAK